MARKNKSLKKYVTKHKLEEIKYEEVEKVAKDVAEQIRIRIAEIEEFTSSKLWHIGYLLFKAEKRVRPEKVNELFQEITSLLADDISPKTLYNCLYCYKRFPNVREKIKATNLTFSHYYFLSGIASDELRKELEEKASKHYWSVRTLRMKIGYILGRRRDTREARFCIVCGDLVYWKDKGKEWKFVPVHKTCFEDQKGKLLEVD